MTAGPKAGRWIWRRVCGGELGGAHWFHFQGPRMKDQELEGRILEGLIARASGMAPGRVRALSFLTVSHLLWNQGSSLKTQSLWCLWAFLTRVLGSRLRGFVGHRVSRWFWDLQRVTQDLDDSLWALKSMEEKQKCRNLVLCANMCQSLKFWGGRRTLSPRSDLFCVISWSFHSYSPEFPDASRTLSNY